MDQPGPSRITQKVARNYANSSFQYEIFKLTAKSVHLLITEWFIKSPREERCVGIFYNNYFNQFLFI